MKYYLILFIFSFTLSYFYFESGDKAGRELASFSKDSESTLSLPDFNYRRSFITLDHTIDYKGLTLMPSGEGEYTKRLFGKLVQEADRLSRDDFYKPEINVYRSYYSFLFAAIQVPFHESNITHFVKRDKSYCYLVNNYLDKNRLEGRTVVEQLKKEIRDLEAKAPLSSEQKDMIKVKRAWLNKGRGAYSIAQYMDKNFKNFYNAYSQGFDIFKECTKIEPDENNLVQQILFSNDYADVGIMMLNALSHPAIFTSGDIFDTEKVIKYGLNYLYSGLNNSGGFKSVVNNTKDYDCLSNVEFTYTSEYYLGLIKGTWAGQYNSGNVSKTCRFADRNNRWANNDRAFYNNLRKSFDEEYRVGSVWHGYLASDTIERKAFKEIVKNVLTGSNDDTYIKRVLSTDYDYQVDSPDIVSDGGFDDGIDDDIDDEQDDVTSDNGSNSTGEDDTSLDQTSDSEPVEDSRDNQDVLVDQTARDILDHIITEFEEQPIDAPVIGKDKPIITVDNSVKLPILDKKPVKHIIDGTRINIRKFPRTASDVPICGNTYYTKRQWPIYVDVVAKVKNNYYEVKSESVKDMFTNEDCDNLEHVFIYGDFLKEVEEVTDKKMIELKTSVVTRYGAGVSKRLTNKFLKAGKYTYRDKHIFYGRYVWLEVVNSSGEKVWFYAGENSQRVEYIQ